MLATLYEEHPISRCFVVLLPAWLCHWQETHVSIAYEGSHMGHRVLQFEMVKVQ